MEDLGALTSPFVAVTRLTFIAYAPGFMNAFLIMSLLMDQRPARIFALTCAPTSSRW